jgi:acyl-CoA synthetase (AMP-forming)/AMP-acid ligase II
MAETARRTIQGRSIRWDESGAQAAYDGGWWVRETLADVLRREAARDPGRVLVKAGEAEITAAGLLERAERLAQALLARMAPGSAITFMLPNWREAAEIYLGATLAGMVVNPVLPSLRDHDLTFILGDVASRLIFVPAHFRKCDYGEMLDRVCAAMDDPPEVAILRGDAGEHTAYEALFEGEGGKPLPELEPDAVRMIMYTSGTTGSPKGVMHTHNTLHALILQLGQHWLIDAGDKFLVPSPISHIGGSIYAFEMPLMLGTTCVLMEQWNAAEAMPIFTSERITHMAGATPFLEQLLAAARQAGTDLPDLKVFICGGASVPPSLIYEASDYFAKACVSRVYGSTEVPVTTVGVMDRSLVKYAAETDGKPGIADVRLGDADEICMKGPQMLVGYSNPQADETAFDADGYYRSGDQGQWVDGEYLVVSGRIKDIIIRHGENIAPKEIEDILVAHPGVAEIAIVGLPDERTGERACAVIVPAPGETPPDLAGLKEFLDARGVARFKIPEQVEYWDALPKNDAGKVVKHKMRSTLLGE